MDLHLGNLKKEWDSQKKDEYKPDAKDKQKEKDEKRRAEIIPQDMLRYIKKAEEEWDKV